MKRDELAMEVVLTAGKLMIESGADMARVDDTMYRLSLIHISEPTRP